MGTKGHIESPDSSAEPSHTATFKNFDELQIPENVLLTVVVLFEWTVF